MTDKESELLNQLIEEVRQLNGKFDTYIHNDKATGRQGVVSKVDTLEKEIIEIKVRDRVNKERSAAFGGVAGGVLGALVALVQYLYKVFQ